MGNLTCIPVSKLIQWKSSLVGVTKRSPNQKFLPLFEKDCLISRTSSALNGFDKDKSTLNNTETNLTVN